MPRDDYSFGEDACIAFAIYCDENSLSEEEGEQLAQRIADGLAMTAQDRRAYLPATLRAPSDG